MIRHILVSLGVEAEPPLWEEWDAQAGEGVEIGSDWDLLAQPAADFEVDQRANW